jgi:predicted ATP-binding protein involved in virulence
LENDRFFVKTLKLENFRCFKSVELGPFDPHFSLLVGENGAGKSSVLVALASIFRRLAKGPGDYTTESLVGDRDVRLNHNEPLIMRDSTIVNRKGTLSSSFDWDGLSRTYTERFGIETRSTVMDVLQPVRGSQGEAPEEFSWTRFERDYPLFLRFGTNRRFQQTLSLSESGVDALTDRFGAFRDWTDVGASADELRKWMRDETIIALQHEQTRLEGVGKTISSATGQLRLVQQACGDSVEGATGIQYVGSRRDIVVSFDDGRDLDFSTMSDGQRALVGMVAEIARRACLLNSAFFGNDSLTKTTGLVLIDEIDLHLHPKWQRRVIRDLKRIFPKIQFFATTHSPQVIGEARPEEIVLLTRQGQKKPMGGYGMDSNWILECVMDAEGRDPDIARRIKALFDAIDDDRLEEARAMIAQLRKEIGNAPDLVGAESYIWRIEHKGDEAAE